MPKGFKLLISQFILAFGMIQPIGAQPLSTNDFEVLNKAYVEYGNGKYMIQEEITQISHILQAAHIAELVGAPEDVVVGLLLHDIGQVIDAKYIGEEVYLHQHHDELGQAWLLDRGYPSFVADLVGYHTLVKVVLAQEEPDYYDNLSTASKISYKYQKEKFELPENKTFFNQLLQHPRIADLKAARRCDEMAKIIGLEILDDNNPNRATLKPFKAYAEMIYRVKNGEGKPAIDPEWRSRVKSMHAFMVKDRAAFEAMVIGNERIDFAWLDQHLKTISEGELLSG